MKKKKFFNRINFNKPWKEEDWEKFFEAQDEFRQDTLSGELRKKPMPRIEFSTGDEVEAFEPILREYGLEPPPSVLRQISGADFKDWPAGDENSQGWLEGAPLSNLNIYRDCCRFSIVAAREMEHYLKRKDEIFKKLHHAEFDSLRFHANWAAINVAHGHKIGVLQDQVYGNAAKCRRAVKHIDVCIRLINQISHRTRSVRLRSHLFSFAVQIRKALYEWIDELKSGGEPDQN